jgi:hypothetical protein
MTARKNQAARKRRVFAKSFPGNRESFKSGETGYGLGLYPLFFEQVAGAMDAEIGMFTSDTPLSGYD